MVEVSFISIIFITATTFVDYVSQMTEQNFDNIPDNWKIYPSINDPVQLCDGKSILGGYNKVGRGNTVVATFTDIPLHTQVRVKFKSYTIDSWDYETVSYDVGGYTFQRTFWVFSSNQYLCGIGFPDNYFNETFEIPHTTDTLTVKFTNNLDETPDNESWGIRDFVLQLLPVQCVQLYSECNYQGILFEFCQGQPDEGWLNQPKIIKSVKLHGSGTLTLTKSNYQTITFKQNNPCIDEYDFPKGENPV